MMHSNSRVVVVVASVLVSLCMVAHKTQQQAQEAFRIHEFDVGQGDSQLIVFPSGFSVLVDCMEPDTDTNEMATIVAGKINSTLGTNYVDVCVISHMHTDHIGMTYQGGVWSLIEQQGIVFGKIVDRNGATWVDKNGDGKCTTSELEYIDAGALSSTGYNWMCYILNPVKYPKVPQREVSTVCSTSLVTPPDANAKITIVAANGEGAEDESGNPIAADHTSESTPPDENDYSIGLLVQFGNITYFTAGDLSGQYECGDDYCYHDIESTVSPRVGKLDILRVNHHGSSHSSNQNWVSALSPTVSIISVGADNTYGHPSQDVMNRLLAVGDVFTTEKGNPTIDYGTAVVSNGDITVTSTDGLTFTVNAANQDFTYESRCITPPTCKV